MDVAAWILRFGLFSLLSTVALPASALRIDLVPADSTISLSGSAPLDLVVSGLDADAQVVSSYDIFLSFDDSVLSVGGVTFGSALGGPVDSISGFDASTPGALEVFEVSVLLDSALDLLQGDSVTLATISFSGIGLGTSSVQFASVTITGAAVDGVPATLEPDLGGARVTVEARAVPEPGSLALLALGLVTSTLAAHGRGTRQTISRA